MKWVDYLRLVNGHSERQKTEWTKYYQLLYVITGDDGYKSEVARLNYEPEEKITLEEYNDIIKKHKEREALKNAGS